MLLGDRNIFKLLMVEATLHTPVDEKKTHMCDPSGREKKVSLPLHLTVVQASMYSSVDLMDDFRWAKRSRHIGNVYCVGNVSSKKKVSQ